MSTISGALPLREQQRRERRDAILDAFAEALATAKEEDVPVDLIAERAGVSRATVFNYFPSKRDIVYAIADREIDALSTLADERSAAGDAAIDTISEVMYRLVAISFSEPLAGWRVLKRILDDPQLADSPADRLFALIERLVRASMNEGGMSMRLDATRCARAIVGTYLTELYAFATAEARGGATHGGATPLGAAPGASARAESQAGADAEVQTATSAGKTRPGRTMDRALFEMIAGQLLSSWEPDRA
jgi:AcrR family transcriptional regulator